MTRIPRVRVLAVIGRFDEAVVADVAGALGRSDVVSQRVVWKALQDLVGRGLVERTGERNTVARYHITDKGREALKAAA